ncbi:MAG: hypothetical protein ACKOB4_18230, partial [Acidobacteriota bacterium]
MQDEIKNISEQINEVLGGLLGAAMRAREPLFDARHESAFRLFNGFSEGFPELAIDLYGRTLVINDYAENVLEGVRNMAIARGFYEER